LLRQLTETTLGEDTRDGILVSQVGKERVQVRKAHSLIGRVYDPRNLARAWARVKENRGAGGVDRISIDRFEREHRRYLTVLHQRLAEGRYRPLPVRRVEIDKPGSTAKRPLDGVPIEVVSTLLGHAHVTTTAAVYGHLTVEDARRVLEQAGWFTGREVRW
jgi:integrase